MKLDIKDRIIAIKAKLFKQQHQLNEAKLSLDRAKEKLKAANEFINGVEPTKKPIEPTFKPTDKKVMYNTIGRDASEQRKRNIPHFDEDLRTTHTPNIAFMHSVVRVEFGKY